MPIFVASPTQIPLAIAPVALPDLQGILPLVVRLFLIGAATGALVVIIFLFYAYLAPRVRRYVSRIRMRRIRRIEQTNGLRRDRS